MIVAFDALDRYETPLFYICNPGCELSDSGVLTNVLGVLSDTSDEEIVFNFNAKSELSLRAYKRDDSDAGQQAQINAMFDALESRRMIYVENIGFFSITNVVEGYDNYTTYKDVTAASCEAEIENKQVPYIADGTYPFLSSATEQGLLNTLVASLPLWQIDHVDEAVTTRYRTFEDVDETQNIYSFMLEDLQDAYECIFVFDTLRRYISVYDRDQYIRKTDIHLTKEDLIQSVKIDETSDDLYTALTVAGDEDSVNIAAVNPLGTRTIYDFSYYLSWMTPELRAKVEEWSAKVQDYADPYYEYSIDYYDLMTEVSNYDSEIARIDVVLDMYKRCRDNIVAESSNRQVASYNAVIAANGGTEISNESDIEELKLEIDTLIANTEADRRAAVVNRNTTLNEAEEINDQMQLIRNDVAFENNFSDALMEELMNYIFEGSYTDEYVTTTDIMTQSEKLAQIKILYDRAVVELEKISQPTYKFTIDVENFVFESEFAHATEELETGCIINVELEPNDIAELFLTTIELNWFDHQLTLTFGNRYNKYDPKALFESVLGNVTKSANAISYIKDLISPIANGELNEMQMAIDNSRNLTKNMALTATDNEVQIDDTGYLGRKLLNDGTYDPEQIKIVNNSIVFTDDAWDTAKTAIGKIVLADGTTVYGVNAEVLIGNMIIGNTLHIGFYDSQGNEHDLGEAVANVIPQYYLSDSTIELIGGEWTFDMPSSKPEGKYLWTRDVVTYLDSGIAPSYTEPVCLDANDFVVGARNFVLKSDVPYISAASTSITYASSSGDLAVVSPVLTASGDSAVTVQAADGVIITETQDSDDRYDLSLDIGTQSPRTVSYSLSETIPDIAQGKTFMLSFYAYTTGTASVSAALFDGDTNLSGWSDSISITSGSSVRYTLAGISVDDISRAHTLKMVLTAASGYLVVKNVKLEFGDIATSWTPAPEDLEGQIKEVDGRVETLTTVVHNQGSALDVVQDQISSKVWSEDIEQAITVVDGEIANIETRVARNESDIIQNANEISLKVSSSDYNGNMIASLINQDATTVQISAAHINLNGQIVASMFAPSLNSALLSNTTVKQQYYMSTSSTSLAGGSWGDAPSGWTTTNKYVWVRTATTKTDAGGATTTTYDVTNGRYDANLSTALSTSSSANATLAQWAYDNNRTLIDGGVVATNTLLADAIHLYGKMTVYQNATTNTVGGYIGYMAGKTSTGSTTNGIALADINDNNYVIATNSGVRLTQTSGSVPSEFNLSGGWAEVRGSGAYIQGTVYLNATSGTSGAVFSGTTYCNKLEPQDTIWLPNNHAIYSYLNGSTTNGFIMLISGTNNATYLGNTVYDTYVRGATNYLGSSGTTHVGNTGADTYVRGETNYLGFSGTTHVGNSGATTYVWGSTNYLGYSGTTYIGTTSTTTYMRGTTTIGWNRSNDGNVPVESAFRHVVNGGGYWYFVDELSGNDTTGNGSASSPWKTLDRFFKMANTYGGKTDIRCYLFANPNKSGATTYTVGSDSGSSSDVNNLHSFSNLVIHICGATADRDTDNKITKAYVGEDQSKIIVQFNTSADLKFYECHVNLKYITIIAPNAKDRNGKSKTDDGYLGAAAMWMDSSDCDIGYCNIGTSSYPCDLRCVGATIVNNSVINGGYVMTYSKARVYNTKYRYLHANNSVVESEECTVTQTTGFVHAHQFKNCHATLINVAGTTVSSADTGISLVYATYSTVNINGTCPTNAAGYNYSFRGGLCYVTIGNASYSSWSSKLGSNSGYGNVIFHGTGNTILT